MAELDLACYRAVRGTCPSCESEDELLYVEAGYEDTEPRVCPSCYRKRAAGISRQSHCDSCGKRGAWRNPYTRRNELLCDRCHAESGDGVPTAGKLVAARVSQPLGVRTKQLCALRSNLAGTQCRGQLKPRTVEGLPKGSVVCDRHAGKDPVT